MAGDRPVFGRWFEDLTPGLVIDHALTRTVTEADNTLFSAMTMNPAQLHLDEVAAAEGPFGTRVVNSIFTLGLVVGISVLETTHGTTIANLGFDEVVFPAPVFPGDTIRVQSEVRSSRLSASRPGAGVVVFEHRGHKQDDTLVVRCTRSALMRCRPS